MVLLPFTGYRSADDAPTAGIKPTQPVGLGLANDRGFAPNKCATSKLTLRVSVSFEMPFR
jgi:hypothetical protein